MAFYARDRSLQQRPPDIASPGNLGLQYGREFSHFEKEINGRLNEMNKTINATLAEHKASSQKASSELKQEILSLQRSVEGIIKAMEDKPVSSSKNKKIPSELSVRKFPAKSLELLLLQFSL